MSVIPLLGYTDRLSGRPGDEIAFKVSSESSEPYDASLVRVICGDPNPAGPGLQLEDVDLPFGGEFPSRSQPFHPGSHAVIPFEGRFRTTSGIAIAATIWPTTPGKARQGIISCGAGGGKPVLNLCLDRGAVTVIARSSSNRETLAACRGSSIKPRRWYRVWAGYDAGNGTVSVGFRALDAPPGTANFTVAAIGAVPIDDLGRIIVGGMDGDQVQGHFNGKIEAPSLVDVPVEEIDGHAYDVESHQGAWARWDFARDTSSTRVVDIGPFGLHGRLVNMPARAMTGSGWTGEEMSWKHAPDQYGAIHFHEDDIYDFGWETDFTFKIPEGMRSGLYAARIRCGEHEDMMPFYVCPPQGRPAADLCVLAATFTYTVYGNHARPNFHPSWLDRISAWNAYPWNPAVHPEYGLSTYNFHTDGSGICHANHRRPLFSLRPGYITFGATEGDCSGLRHLQADTHLYAWLEKMGISFDIVTDQELHDDGIKAIEGYRAVTTGSHPEYHTPRTLDALQQYRDRGGHFMYLGGNGFYWRIAVHPEGNGTLEIRRNEGGIRAWAAEPGEYFQAFDGGYGGLWRRNNRPPQQLAAVGFSAQGNFHGSYYRIDPDARVNPETAWIFEGVESDTVGDYGYSGNGAAGFELDRADYRLGTPENTRVIASSENHHESFIPVPEELLTHITTWSGEPLEKLIRADMVYQRSDSGSQLFSTGSITFCGTLLHNDADNDISRIVANVLRRFLSPEASKRNPAP
ncbi:MAG: N,N-dimethylformamidase large subunit [Gemmatimonadetes bacterium]|nr:N,N-dimethylformamidase large subunit [Gemmatimonadota bacterium]